MDFIKKQEQVKEKPKTEKKLMDLVLKGTVDVNIFNNKITSEYPFEVELTENTLLIKSDSSSSNCININGNSIQYNDIEINNGIVIGNNNSNINFSKNGIFINGVNIKDKIKDSFKEKKKEIKGQTEYDLNENFIFNTIKIKGQSKLCLNENNSSFENKFFEYITSINVSGQSSIKISNYMFDKDLRINCSGQSDVVFDNNKCENLFVECSGQSSVKLKTVQGNILNLDATGMSDISCKDVKFNSVSKLKSGMSDIKGI